MKIVDKNKLCIVINLDLLTELTNELHILYIHIGTVKVLIMINEKFYYKGMRSQIAKILKTCHICQTTKYDNKNKNMPLQIIKADRVRQIISTDLYDELPVGRGSCRYIFNNRILYHFFNTR